MQGREAQQTFLWIKRIGKDSHVVSLLVFPSFARLPVAFLRSHVRIRVLLYKYYPGVACRETTFPLLMSIHKS